MINWKIAKRNKTSQKKDYLIKTINSSILLDLTSFLEGITTEILLEIIWIRNFKDEANSIYLNNVTRYLDTVVLKSSWRDTLNLLESITGNKVSDFVEPEVLKSINILFSFRNLLTHGLEIEIEYFEKDNKTFIDTNSKYKPIVQFLKEKKLLDLSFEPYLNSANILSNAVIDFFKENTYIFIGQLFPIVKDFDLEGLKGNFEDSLKIK